MSVLEHSLSGACDVAILFSHDTDLLPAVESVARLKGRRHIETASWVSDGHRSRLRPQGLGGTVHHHEITEQLFARVETRINFAQKT